MNSSTSNGRWDRLIGVAFVIGGSTALSSGLSGLHQAYRSNAWPPAPGVILRLGVGTNRGNAETFEPRVLYRYEVADVEHESARIGIAGRATGSRSDSEAWVAGHEVGEAVTAFYDPANPAEAVLERGLSAGSWLLPGLGSLFGAFGVFLWSRGREASPAGGLGSPGV